MQKEVKSLVLNPLRQAQTPRISTHSKYEPLNKNRHHGSLPIIEEDVADVIYEEPSIKARAMVNYKPNSSQIRYRNKL